MDAVIEGVGKSPIPLKLTICALRHENDDMARRLADLSLDYQDYVGVFDLAGDEELYPGVLEWWISEATRVRETSGGKTLLTIHLTETRKPTGCDEEMVRKHAIDRIGHGIKGDWTEVLEICPTSNVVTGQIASYADHPINRLLQEGKKVTVNTDGTLFTQVQLSDEYQRLKDTFGWKAKDFLKVNLTALEASSFSKKDKENMRARLVREYGDS